jgi:hypothetical protein
MLQIITEKFFPPGERYETLHRAIFYTNYRIMRGEKIVTPGERGHRRWTSE